ncbi:MAG: hypothetical protein A2Z12_07465 [Actinobacteria bacterium RBG_16_68_21]|nr:MAG: hypothetical protein A2Z12_07465 [Actinobacteria bacterium RBG_16_68_21]
MRRLIGILALAIAAAACGGGAGAPSSGPFPEAAFAFSASSNLAVGTQRLLVAVATPEGSRLAAPTIPVTIAVWPEGSEDLSRGLPGEFIWAIPEVSGLYKVTFQFDQPGLWTVRVTPNGGPALEDFTITVIPEASTPAFGDPAPASDTPVAADHPIAEISTDPEPDPRFYQLSVADAVTSGRPTVVVFATPKFCQTAICGPTLDRVKEVADAYPDVNFVHVEVYTNLDDPANLEVVPAVVEWGLPTEPWVFVIDAGGIVTAAFEGVVTPEELTAALGG